MWLQTEIFVYDRNLLAPRSHSSIPTVPPEQTPQPFVPREPPESVADENSLQSWQSLFKERRAWAVKLSEKSDSMLDHLVQADTEIAIIRRATAVAVENVRQHISAVFSKYRDIRSWARDILKDQTSTPAGWEDTMRRFSRVGIDAKLGKLFRGPGDELERGTEPELLSLESLASTGEHRHSVARAQQVAEELQTRLSELERQYSEITRVGNDLVESFNQDFATLTEDISHTVSSLAEEVEVIVKKVNVDYENALALPRSSKSLSAVMKTAVVHSQNFLPSLVETIADVDQLFRSTLQRKNLATEKARSHMQNISSIQSAIATFQQQMGELDLNEEDGVALDALAYVNRLPSAYGSLLVEAVRRHEWNEKVMADSSSLAEDIAVYKDDEERRRRKWLRAMKEYMNDAGQTTKTLGFELNLKSQEQSWPPLTRADVKSYMSSLQKEGGLEDAVKEVEESMKTIDAPTKQQTRHTNALFKNGSINGAGFGRNSLLLRGDDEAIQTLQSEKTRLEDRLKGSESRVRKLEDLLHRASQPSRPIASRPSSSGLDRFSTSPVLPSVAMVSHKPSETDMRRPSFSSRPVSANFGVNDKALIQRVVNLEGELEAEKAKSVKMEENASGNAKVQDALRQQIQDATSTKKDLMDNFEAQQFEFDSERRLIQDDNRKLKIRLEEMEEELDRVLGSQENFKFN